MAKEGRTPPKENICFKPLKIPLVFALIQLADSGLMYTHKRTNGHTHWSGYSHQWKRDFKPFWKTESVQMCLLLEFVPLHVRWWCHPIVLSFVIPFSFCFQSFPASGSFPISQLFASGSLRIGPKIADSLSSSELEGLKTMSLHCDSLSKVSRRQMSQFKSQKFSDSLFILSWFSNDWMRTTLLREGNPLYSFYEFKC